MKGKKIIAMGLAVVMVIFTFTACTKGEKGDEIKTDKAKAMGRYVEKNIPMPAQVENGSEIAYLFLKNPKNQIEMYSRKMEETQSSPVYKNTLEGTEWKREKSEWQSRDNFIFNVAYDEKDVLYGLGMTKEGKVSVFTSTDEKETKEIKLEGLDQLAPENSPMSLYCMKGNILILGFLDHLTAYQDGKEIMTMESSNGVCAIFEKEVLVPNRQGDGVVVYDLESRSKKAEYPFDENTSNAAYTSDEQGKWYLCSTKGIHRLAREGNIWERIVDGSLNSMGSPKYSMETILADDQNKFYMVYQYGDGKRIIKQYVYDETVETVPSKVLSIQTLEESQTIHQAAVDFQNANPDVRVDYEVLLSEGGVTATDVVKKLNTELLAKKGPDLIVLDGMPVQSYIEKEVLMDLSETLLSLSEKEGIYKNLIDASKTGEKIYGMPVKIGLPIIFGKKEAVAAGSTLEDLAKYAEHDARTALFGEKMYTHESLIQLLAEIYGKEYKDEEGKIDEKKMSLFLEKVKIISDQTKTVDRDKSISMEDMYRYNMENTDLLVQKLAECSIVEYKTSFDYYAPFVGIEKIGGSFAPLADSFIPHGTIGINKASTNQDLAVSFFNSLFTEALQKVDLEDGFPVTEKGVAAWNKDKNDFYIGTPSFEARQPKEEKIKEVTGLCGTLKEAMTTDTVLVEMITNEAIPYLKGEKTAEETAAAIAGQAKAYLSE